MAKRNALDAYARFISMIFEITVCIQIKLKLHILKLFLIQGHKKISVRWMWLTMPILLPQQLPFPLALQEVNSIARPSHNFAVNAGIALWHLTHCRICESFTLISLGNCLRELSLICAAKCKCDNLKCSSRLSTATEMCTLIACLETRCTECKRTRVYHLAII